MKELLSQAGVPYEERNVTQSDAHRQELVDMGYRAIPVTIVGDEAVVGFDRARLARLIEVG